MTNQADNQVKPEVRTESDSDGSLHGVVGLHMVINQAKGKCGEDVPHVFDSSRLPPADSHRCMCGKRTWKQAVADAEAAALKAHTANAASVQSNNQAQRQPPADVSERKANDE